MYISNHGLLWGGVLGNWALFIYYLLSELTGGWGGGQGDGALLLLNKGIYEIRI